MKRPLILCVGFLFCCVALSVAGQTQNAADGIPQINISGIEQAAQGKHPITLDEIVSFREVKEPHRSPDGSRVAFLVKQAFRSCDCYRTALYVVNTNPGNAPDKLLEESSLSSIRWSPGGKYISYLSSKSGSQQLWRIDPDTKVAEQVFNHTPGADQTISRIGYHPSDTTSVGVFTYEWSPDGQEVAFTTSPPIDNAELEQRKKNGILFGENMDLTTLMFGQWIHVPGQVWVYNLKTKSERLLWENRTQLFGGEISSVAWSPDSHRIAVAYAAPPKLKESRVYFNQDVGIVDVETGKFTVVANGEAVETLPQWSPDGKFLAYCSVQGYTNSPLVVYELATGTKREFAPDSNARQYWWADDGSALIYQSSLLGKRRSRNGLYRVPLDGHERTRITSEEIRVDDCDGVSKGVAACVWQSSNIPPSPALVDIASGKPRGLADINPEMRNITVGYVSELRWTNKYGAETTGYLIKPFQYTPGKRYPLLIILYGFEGEFVTQAEWLSSYPAQAFARDGFAVLMTNYPPYDDWNGKDFAKGTVAEGYSPLASIEAGVNMLVKDGLADSHRVGIMGISYGGFLTEFAITQSHMFKVSSLVDGGGYGNAAYALEGHNGHENDEKILGGPPYGSTLKNWLSFSPPLNADRINGPVLMGFNDHEAIYGLEMRSALAHAGVPFEFWVYPGDGHIFTEPEHRYVSMERNVDWFNFWLQHKEDPSPGKHSQYERWHELRKQEAAHLEKMHESERAASALNSHQPAASASR
ncbi:MAG: prolyl oligopeptidase family serine peptidase [Terriglobia bacterium]|nr:prolyl oligopeptidase family serine peptidase [Terriglobia bacterium]